MPKLLLICQGDGNLKHDSGSKATYAYRSHTVYLHVLKEGECSGTLVRVPPCVLLTMHPTTGYLNHCSDYWTWSVSGGGLYVMPRATAPHSQIVVLHACFQTLWQVAPMRRPPFRVTYSAMIHAWNRITDDHLWLRNTTDPCIESCTNFNDNCVTSFQENIAWLRSKCPWSPFWLELYLI